MLGDELGRLRAVTTALVGAQLPEDVARVVCVEMARAVGADQAILAVPHGASDLTLMHLSGFRPGEVDSFLTFPVTADLPAAVAYRTRQPFFIRDREELARRLPNLPFPPESVTSQSMATLPLVVNDRVLGAIGFGYIEVQPFDDAALATIDEMGRQTALALERSRLLEEARREARARAEVLQVVSHDLGNPLVSLRVSLQQLERAARELDAWPALERLVTIANRSATALDRLIADLVDAGRLETGGIHLRCQPCRLGQVVGNAVDLLRDAALEAGIRLECAVTDPDARVDCDPARVNQVLTNLVTNAVAVCKSGDTITVRGEQAGDLARISVTDPGPGIPLEHQSRVFERFWRGPAAEPRSGMGLGLTIAKAIVDAHAGGIVVTSSPGQGATFTFTLPLRPSTR